MSTFNDNSNSGASNRETITTTELRDRLEKEIHTAIAAKTASVIQAPTCSGKSHTVATTAWSEYPELTDECPVLHFSTTTDSRDEAADKSKKAGLDYVVLEGRDDACPVASGEHDNQLDTIGGQTPSEWIDTMCNIQHISFSRVHAHLEDHYDPLPCCQGSDCKSISQIREVCQEDNRNGPKYDVIHATDNFAHVPNLIEDANVIFDEQPQFKIAFDQETVRKTATHEIKKQSGGELRWAGLTEAVRTQDKQSLREFQSILADQKPNWPDLDSEVTDTVAINVARALANATVASDEQELYVGQSGNVGIVMDGENTIQEIYQVPALDKVRTVIGLDAHPSSLRWRLNTGRDLHDTRLLTTEEQRSWRREERRLETVQIGEHTQSLTKGWRSEGQQKRAEAIIHAVRSKHGDDFRTCVCPKEIQSDVECLMKDAGVSDPELMTYGNLKSRNAFTGETIGLVVGCIDPGDAEILGKLGMLGLDAEPEMYETDGSTRKRKHGRGFTGPGRDAATELLESVREMNVAQGIGRYARNPNGAEGLAKVYVWTDAVPEELVDAQVPGTVEKLTEVKQEIVDYFMSSEGSVTAREIENETGFRKPTILNVLNQMVNLGNGTVSEGTGDYGANEYEYLSGIYRPGVELTPRSS